MEGSRSGKLSAGRVRRRAQGSNDGEFASGELRVGGVVWRRMLRQNGAWSGPLSSPYRATDAGWSGGKTSRGSVWRCASGRGPVRRQLRGSIQREARGQLRHRFVIRLTRVAMPLLVYTVGSMGVEDCWPIQAAYRYMSFPVTEACAMSKPAVPWA